MDREPFNFSLCRIEQGIIKEPTVMVPNTTEPHRQLAITIYRMAHDCSFKVLKSLSTQNAARSFGQFGQMVECSFKN